MTTDTLSVDEIRRQIKELEGELAKISGKPLKLRCSTCGKMAERPFGGATLTIRWPDLSKDEDWYPSTEAAKAALLTLAREHEVVPDDSCLNVDLNPGMPHQTFAWVTRYEQ